MKTKRLIHTALFAALTSILAQIVIPLGPIPFNLAVLGALLAGMLLPPLYAAGSMIIYLVLGAVGVPVFASFSGGLGLLLGKTGGYIIGYIFIALFTAFGLQLKLKAPLMLTVMCVGILVCYALGTAWFMIITKNSLSQSLIYCVYPFILPDLAKTAAAYILGKKIKTRGISVT